MVQPNNYFLAYRVGDVGTVRLLSESGVIYEKHDLIGWADPLIMLVVQYDLHIAASTIPAYYVVKTTVDFLSELEKIKSIENDKFKVPFKELQYKSTTIVKDNHENWDKESEPFYKRYLFESHEGWIGPNNKLGPEYSIGSTIKPQQPFPNTSVKHPNEWWLDLLKFSNSPWQYDPTKTPGVAVIDKGIEATHSVFYDSWSNVFNLSLEVIERNIYSKCQAGDVVQDFTGNRDRLCSASHGTAVASVICGKKNRFSEPGNELISFIPGAPISVVKGYHGYQDEGALLAALTHAAFGAQVINVSAKIDWGVPYLVEFLKNFDYLIVVAAAGNDGDDFDQDKNNRGFGISPNLLSVTAVDETGQLRCDANRGSVISFAAPGRNIPIATTSNGTSYSGQETSIAAAIMTGIVARVIDHDPASFACKPIEVIEFLNQTQTFITHAYNDNNRCLPVRLSKPIPVPDLSFL